MICSPMRSDLFQGYPSFSDEPPMMGTVVHRGSSGTSSFDADLLSDPKAGDRGNIERAQDADRARSPLHRIDPTLLDTGWPKPNRAIPEAGAGRGGTLA